MAKRKRATAAKQAESYDHPESNVLLRPDAGTQPQFRKKKPPQRYRYDSSLSPSMEWDGQNPAREEGERLIAEIIEQSRRLERAESDDERREAAAAVRQAAERLRALGRPLLNWAGKAERTSFDVPTLPLFVHERLSTKAIIETLCGHRRDKQMTLYQMFGDPDHSIADQVLRAYEHRDRWVNRMMLGDSLVVMNSLLRYENLGGQVQMIYMDPPYGVKFGSNFQPFVRKRDVKHNDDEDLTREPEMVQAYRDTWECGLHSYLTYLRDRLLLCRELLAPSGSVFVQISDENVHHVRELMDEVFGAENFAALITFQKTTGQSSPLAKTDVLTTVADYLLWYSRDRSRVKYRELFLEKGAGSEDSGNYRFVEFPDGSRRQMTAEELTNPKLLPDGSRIFRYDNLTSAQTYTGGSDPFEFEGEQYVPPPTRGWSTTHDGLARLARAGRLFASGHTLCYIRYLGDFPVIRLNNVWPDTVISGFGTTKLYVVQTMTDVVQRCLLMTTDPGDLVLDPTCGSGTTAYVAEQWGRRWIAIDVSRVPLALARQRLLTATFPWYELKDESRGPAGGFVYCRKQNKRGEETGGIVPHVTLKSIANNEPPAEEVLVDRPETTGGITRVTGPFTFEATIPTPVDWEESEAAESEARAGRDEPQGFCERMLEILRRSPVLRVEGNKTVQLTQVRLPAKTLALSAEAMVVSPSPRPSPQGGEGVPVAFVFGPENGAVSERLVFEAAREAAAKHYAHLYVIGFAIQPNARTLVDQSDQVMGVPATYVQATPDLLMGDLLKNMRSSQIFSVCGLPEIEVRKVKPKGKNGTPKYEVELQGLDVFDPVEMKSHHRPGCDVPAWFLDTDYNGRCFHVCQAFFPRTGAWDNLRRSLKGEFDESVWEHLAGTTSAPFEAGGSGQVGVKVIDDRGNELLVVKAVC